MAAEEHTPEFIFDQNLSFFDRALQAYHFQFEQNPVYRTFAGHFLKDGESPKTLSDIPLLPIRAFKELDLIVDGKQAEITFRSSGTGSMQRSRHHVADTDLYGKSIDRGFSEHFNPEASTILCYAPGYSDNPDSSLIWMLNHLVRKDNTGMSRFLPLGQPLTRSELEKTTRCGRSVILFGAAFGLLDLIDAGSDTLLESAHIIETGGMKTHRREMSKTELRNRLSEGLGVPLERIHSEYGMCELLSQMYAIGSEWFTTPHWMHVSVRDPQDPFRICDPGEEGKIGIIDAANIYSCPFLLTEDRGVMNEEGHIAIRGRWNPADLRGCNFLIDQD